MFKGKVPTTRVHWQASACSEMKSMRYDEAGKRLIIIILANRVLILLEIVIGESQTNEIVHKDSILCQLRISEGLLIPSLAECRSTSCTIQIG